MNDDGDMDKMYLITTSIGETLVGRSFLLLELDIHMLEIFHRNICNRNLEFKSLSPHSFGRPGTHFFFFFSCSS